MSAKWNLVIDIDLCVNCHNCVLATKDEHIGNEFPGYSAAQSTPGLDTIRIEKSIRGGGTQVEMTYVPRLCNHCDDAPCMKADNRNAIRKRSDGIVIIDPELSRGAADMPATCPFGMIQWDHVTNIPHIWNFDAHLLDAGWTEPRCSQACPTGAMKAVKLSDVEMAAMVASEGLEQLPLGISTRPRIHYRNAERLRTHLIAGTIVRTRERGQECADGVRIELIVDGLIRGAEQSDAFGEFRFKAVPATAHQVDLRICEDGKAERIVAIAPRTSQVIEILL